MTPGVREKDDHALSSLEHLFSGATDSHDHYSHAKCEATTNISSIRG